VGEISDGLQRVKTNQSAILLKDFNADVRNIPQYGGVQIGRHGNADINDNGRLL